MRRYKPIYYDTHPPRWWARITWHLAVMCASTVGILLLGDSRRAGLDGPEIMLAVIAVLALMQSSLVIWHLLVEDWDE